MKKLLNYRGYAERENIAIVAVPEQELRSFKQRMRDAAKQTANNRRKAVMSASKVILTQ